MRPPSREAALRGGGSSGRRGAALARVDTRRRSGRSSLRLRRKRCAPCALRARHSLPSRPCDTTSSKRARCFLGMKILQSEGRSRARPLTKAPPSGSSCYFPGVTREIFTLPFDEQTCIPSWRRSGHMMAQEVEARAVKTEDLSSIPWDSHGGLRELTILDDARSALSPYLGKVAQPQPLWGLSSPKAVYGVSQFLPDFHLSSFSPSLLSCTASSRSSPG